MSNVSYRVFGTNETYSSLVTPASGEDEATIATITGGNPLGQTTWVVSDAVGEYLDIGDIAAKGRVGSGTWQPMTISSRDAASGTITLSQSPSSLGYNSFRLYRKTQTEPLVNFVDGARLTEGDLDKAYRQGLFAAQEVAEDAEGIGNLSTANLTLNGTTTVTHLNATGDVTVPDKIIHSGDTDTAIRFPADDTVTCETGGTERMRIDNEGNLLVGGTSDTGFQIVSTATGQHGCLDCVSSSTNGYYALRIDMHANNNYAQLFRQNGSVVGTILIASGATQYNTSSDYRLKENVTYDFDATTRLKQLKPCRFNFTAYPDATVDGFLAHEVQTIVPEAVSGEKDAVDADGNIDPQGIDQSKLIPLLVKTIQELEARIATLEAQ